MLTEILKQPALPQSATPGSQPGQDPPAIPWKAPTLAEAVAAQGAVDTALAARAAGIAMPEAWEIYAETHQFGQMETEALQLLTDHTGVNCLEILITKIRRLALLRYGTVLALVALLLFLPSCVTLGPTSVSYDPATGGWAVSSTALRKAAQAVEILDSK